MPSKHNKNKNLKINKSYFKIFNNIAVFLTIFVILIVFYLGNLNKQLFFPIYH